MKRMLLLLGAAALFVAAPSFAQYVFLDANGDGMCTAADVLTDASTSVDIWFDTDSNKNGTPATCSGGGVLDIFSYEFILQSNGNVTFGAYTNMQASFTTAFGVASGGNDYRNGFGGQTPLAPGAYKAGTLAITVAPGTRPTLSLATTTTLGAYFTAFGSTCPGLDFDNTIKLGSDFMDACGTTSGNPVRSTTWGAIKSIYR